MRLFLPSVNHINIHIYIYIYIYTVCMYACMHACMHVCVSTFDTDLGLRFSLEQIFRALYGYIMFMRPQERVLQSFESV